jgi:hypothetical protein
MALYISKQQILACALGYAGYISTSIGINDDDILIFLAKLRSLIPNDIIFTFSDFRSKRKSQFNVYKKLNGRYIAIIKDGREEEYNLYVDLNIRYFKDNIKREMELNGYNYDDDILYRVINSFNENYARKYGISVSKTNNNNPIILSKKK